jgi:spore germination protein GerM
MPAPHRHGSRERRWLVLGLLAVAAFAAVVVWLAHPRGRTVDVFFIHVEAAGHSAALVPVHRPSPHRATADQLRTALATLLAGPSPAERRRGLVSEIPVGTALRGLRIEDGVVTVDLSAEFARGGGSTSMLGRIWQVVYTATQFRDASAAQILLEGRHVEALGGEGVVIARPLRRPQSPPRF